MPKKKTTKASSKKTAKKSNKANTKSTTNEDLLVEVEKVLEIQQALIHKIDHLDIQMPS